MKKINLKDFKKIEKIFRIRNFEESLDKLFSEGKIFGTFHRCIGQEATAVAFTDILDKENDFVVSNHRNHGHYLSFTEDYEGLLKELMGKESGVTGGRGGSQVIFGKNFISNGIIGSTIPIATGISFSIKIKKKKNCVVCFIGDGAMGQGVVYESLNMASLYKLPILFVVEMNNIAQSTDINLITAGSFQKRFESFNIKSKKIKSSNIFELLNISSKIIKEIKINSYPQAIIVESDRLCAHSKGDDYRKSINKKNDPIETLSINNKDKIKFDSNANAFISRIINSIK